MILPLTSKATLTVAFKSRLTSGFSGAVSSQLYSICVGPKAAELNHSRYSPRKKTPDIVPFLGSPSCLTP